jgi:RNA polymerase II transcription elongation factor
LNANSSLNLDKHKDEYILTSTEEVDSHVFRGQGVVAKDVECVLIFDPQSSSFQLKPLDFTLRVNPSREKAGGNGTAKSSSNNATSVITAGTDSSRSPSISSGSLSRSLSPVTSHPNSGSLNESSKSAAKTSPAPRKPVASKKPPSTGRVAKKSVPSKRPVAKKSTVKPPSNEEVVVESNNDSDVDEDLLGALANELEESLEDDSNDSSSKKAVEMESEDDDQSIEVVDNNKSQSAVASKVNSAFSSPSLGLGPMSLRGFADSSRREEDDLSSSEEE